VTDVTDADRKKATALLRAWREATPEGDLAAVAPRAQIALAEAVAQALADEREKARAPFLALADEWSYTTWAAEIRRRAAEEQQ
jgi:urease accessory protein UreF